MLEIGIYRSLVCDNGKTYLICEGDDYYDYTLREGSWLKEANKVNKYYLEDAIKFRQTICVGRLENGNPENTYIFRVEPSEADKNKDLLESIKNMNDRQSELSKEVNDAIVKLKNRKKFR